MKHDLDLSVQVIADLVRMILNSQSETLAELDLQHDCSCEKLRLSESGQNAHYLLEAI